MERRRLGRDGPEVSAFGLGVMTFGGQTPESDGLRQLDMAFDAGITLFDTAENYPVPLQPGTQGRSEEILGRWISDRRVRDKVVVATKVAGPGNAPGDMRHIRGEHRRLDRNNIRLAVEASLGRLRTDYIDLYQLHWPDRPITTYGRARYSYLPDAAELVPLEESLSALAELVTEGKVRCLGVCNETPWGAMRYLACGDAMGLPRLCSIQNAYSLLDRQLEIGLAEICMREDLGLLGYSPLARGALARQGEMPGGRLVSERRARAIRRYRDIAQAHGLQLSHLALAFARQQPFMTSVLMAASSLEQLRENLGATEVALSGEVVKAVNAVHDADPNCR